MNRKYPCTEDFVVPYIREHPYVSNRMIAEALQIRVSIIRTVTTRLFQNGSAQRVERIINGIPTYFYYFE